jgi:hypothetical protein
MKLQLTEKTELEINRLNDLYGDENSPEYDYWDKMSELETLITDAGLYVNSAYEENEFDNLNEWCIKVGSMEYQQAYLNTHPNAVREKIDRMLRENIIQIICTV